MFNQSNRIIWALAVTMILSTACKEMEFQSDLDNSMNDPNGVVHTLPGNGDRYLPVPPPAIELPSSSDSQSQSQSSSSSTTIPSVSSATSTTIPSVIRSTSTTMPSVSSATSTTMPSVIRSTSTTMPSSSTSTTLPEVKKVVVVGLGVDQGLCSVIDCNDRDHKDGDKDRDKEKESSEKFRKLGKLAMKGEDRDDSKEKDDHDDSGLHLGIKKMTFTSFDLDLASRKAVIGMMVLKIGKTEMADTVTVQLSVKQLEELVKKYSDMKLCDGTFKVQGSKDGDREKNGMNMLLNNDKVVVRKSDKSSLEIYRLNDGNPKHKFACVGGNEFFKFVAEIVISQMAK